MSPIGANLRTLYQCPSIWLWHIVGTIAFFATLAKPLRSPIAGEGNFSVYLTILFWIGLIGAALAKDLMVKPFTFCLPDHGNVSRRALLVVGIGVSAACSFIVLALPSNSVAATLIVLWTAFAMGLSIYLAGALIMMTWDHSAVFFACFFTTVSLSFHDLFHGLRVFVEGVILYRPLEVTLFSVLGILLFSRKVGSRQQSRRMCEANYLPPYSILNTARVGHYQEREQIRRLEKRPRDSLRGLETLFASRMRRTAPKGGGRYFWGNLYVLVNAGAASLSSSHLVAITVALVATVVLGYVGPGRDASGVSDANYALFVPCIGLSSGLLVNAFSTLLLPAGRKERFRGLVTAGLLSGIAVTLISLLIIGFSQALARLAPDIIFRGETHTYLPVAPNALVFFLALTPIVFICQLLFPKRFTIPLIVVTLIALVVFRGNMQVFLQMSPLGIAILLLASWLPFAGLAHHYCYSRDLIRN